MEKVQVVIRCVVELPDTLYENLSRDNLLKEIAANIKDLKNPDGASDISIVEAHLNFMDDFVDHILKKKEDD